MIMLQSTHDDFANRAMRHSAKQNSEIAKLYNMIAELSSQPYIAREAVDRYCDPELIQGAYEWLNSKGL